MSATITHVECPWPGPRPYEVHEGNVYFGRERDILELREYIARARLTILSADSGVGKTSLLRAGLVYNLLCDRKNRATLDEPTTPVLLMRDWGGGARLSVKEIFKASLISAIDDLKAEIPEDHELLAGAKNDLTGNLFKDIHTLCNRTGGLILVFDQFEEVLRAGEETADEAVEMIKGLYKYEPRARIIISLRSEYLHDLNSLETYTGGLSSRTFFMKQMVAKTALEAIHQSVRAVQLEVDDSVIDDLIQMLASNVRGQNAAEGDATPEPDGNELDEKIDLLTLQVILWELYEYNQSKHPGSNAIDKQTYIEYKNNRPSSELLGEALSRWVDRALNTQLASTDHLTMELRAIDPQRITGVVQRIAARLASYLSSGGYKVPAEETDLIYYALRDDFMRIHARLDTTQPSDWSLVTTNPPSLDHEKLDLSTEKRASPERANENLSGLAKEMAWSLAQTADSLVSLFFETVYRLRNGHIVKPIRVQGKLFWELVHDGIGKPFSVWAEKRRETWDDGLYSLTAVRGKNVLIPENTLPNQIAYRVSWNGCDVFSRSQPELINYQFVGSDLKGTIFRNCTFVGGRFDDCLMDGCLFINCRFEAGLDGKPFVFNKCEANGMTFLTPIPYQGDHKSALRETKFLGCNFTQVKFAGIQIGPGVAFQEGSTLLLCQFTRLFPEKSAKIDRILFEGMTMLHCVWDKENGKYIDRRILIDEQGSSFFDPGL